MLTLEDFAPSREEHRIISDLGLPEQVAIGYIRAMRKAHGGKRADTSGFGSPGDLFGGLFKYPHE